MDQSRLADDTPATAEEARMERLKAFTDSLLEKRKAAREARASSGIESIWTEDEEFYDGIDDANREDVAMRKSTTPGGPITSAPKNKTTKSNVFPNFTQTYVDMAAAAIADMLLPTDDKPFGLLPTPEPDLMEAKKDPRSFRVQGPSGEMVEASASQIATEMIQEAKDSAEKAEGKIWDWLTEGMWHTEVRSIIDDAAKAGSGVLKGPMPALVTSRKIDRDDKGNVKITIQKKTNPVSKRISYWNFYPDPACGEDVQRGSYTWEEDTISGRALRELKDQVDPSDGQPYYLTSQIDKVLEEGPSKKYQEGAPRDSARVDADEYTIWYFYGMAEAADFAAAGCQCPEGSVHPVHVAMVNDTPIKVTLSTMESGSFPYDVFIWQRVPGRWWGKGEARKVRTAQRGITGATRAMMNNGGISSGPQIVIDGDAIEPADGVMEITPLKIWRKKAGKELADVRQAILAINIDSRQEQLLNIINYFIEMADKVATMPIQQQGQQGVTEETAEGRRILQNNAGVVKRRLAKMFDDKITEPHIGRYYEWLLLYGDDPSMKRDMVVDARGSSVLFERDASNLAIAQMGAMVKDPAFGWSPKRWAAEYAKSNKLDPKRFELTEEEQAEAAKQQPPADPRIEAAKITAESRLQVAKLDTDRDTKYNQSLTERDKNQAEYLDRKLQYEYELALLKYSTDRKISLDKAKAELAKVAMTLRTQVQLATAPTDAAPQVAPPAVEPRGRAPRGKAFQK